MLVKTRQVRLGQRIEKPLPYVEAVKRQWTDDYALASQLRPEWRPSCRYCD